MELVQLREQLSGETLLSGDVARILMPYVDGDNGKVFSVRRGRNSDETCLVLSREAGGIRARGSYFVGTDWVSEGNVAVQVSPKMNDGFEVDYVRMLNEALSDAENFEHLRDLVTIRFDKPSVRINQERDMLSVFLVTEYLNILRAIVTRGLKKSFYTVEENLHNKVKGRIAVERNIRRNAVRGRVADNVCRYQVYDTDTPENRILKAALRFCVRQLGVYRHVFDTSPLEKKAAFVKPYFAGVGDRVDVRQIRTYRGNPVYRDYNRAVEFARLLMRRYGYDITLAGRKDIPTPPFWIDTSKLFELYVFHRLREVFTGRGEIRYHVGVHYQELDYLLKPEHWPSPYVIDAKYKPRYRNEGISMEDAREISGYARLRGVYREPGLDEDTAPPVKCLVVYPDQDGEEHFAFSRDTEPSFGKVKGYVRFYKTGIKLPVIQSAAYPRE